METNAAFATRDRGVVELGPAMAKGTASYQPDVHRPL